nr:unnamed protein product [Callosobruchus chinensis]
MPLVARSMNLGSYQEEEIPSESSVGNTSSTASSEVSRPVSLTSLGSCSSSGSSGPHQPGSVYLASAESLDSDPEPTGSQGSADSGIAEQEQTTSTPEHRVLQEVLETEAVYVADLGQVIHGICKKSLRVVLKRRAKLTGRSRNCPPSSKTKSSTVCFTFAGGGRNLLSSNLNRPLLGRQHSGYLEVWRNDPDCPLAQHLPYLFNNLEEIYKFNRGFSVYTQYCTAYPRTMEVLSRLTNDDRMAAIFRERQMALGHKLPLGSYLLKPVQRILKYHLLLQRLSKQCASAHKPAVDLALTTMTGIASDINSMKRKHEHAVRVQEIQAQLYGWPGRDLTALGELIAEGTFRVVGARGRRHVFLFEKVLLMAKSKQDGALAYKTHIMSTLKARSLQHKREWTLQIKRAILENYTSVIPNRVRQLVLQLGQDLNEKDAEITEKWSPLKPSTTPHYLERRSRMRKTRDFSNRRASSQDRSFVSLGSWRRKSEPSMIPQYNSKTIPKKITKLKKSKEQAMSATFYTDLSDSETCDAIGESTESLLAQNGNEMRLEEREDEKTDDYPVKTNLEKIVSEILMQNQKMFSSRQITNRRNVTSDPTTSAWYEEKVKLPAKSDSLPRSFQLSDKIETDVDRAVGCKNERLVHDMSAKENANGDVDNELSSRLEDNGEHPEHKIYRKSAIRFSLLQRLRHIVLNEIDKRLNGSSEGSSTEVPDTGQEATTVVEETPITTPCLDSSHISDSYYESLLEDNLTEEYVKDSSGRLVAKQDSFSGNENKCTVVFAQKYKYFEEQAATSGQKRFLKLKKRFLLATPKNREETTG